MIARCFSVGPAATCPHRDHCERATRKPSALHAWLPPLDSALMDPQKVEYGQCGYYIGEDKPIHVEADK